jgi:hypothetical protein
MTRTHKLSLILLAGSTVVFAQQPGGGWRRASDPPPVAQNAPSSAQTSNAPSQNVPSQNVPTQDDPSQPVDRSDAYGQAQSSPQQASPQQASPQQVNPQQARPQQNDRPPAARTSAPRYGLPPQVTIRPGTFVTVRTEQPLSSDRNQEGDTFAATLTQPIVVDGVVVAQRGQTVMGRVAEAKKAGRAAGVSHLSLQLTGLTLADGTQSGIQSQMVTRNGQTSVGNDVAAVGTTTAVGAAIGAAADWGRGAAIGAGAGAVVGLAGVLLTRGHPTVVYPETLLSFRIDTPVTVDTSRAPQAFRYVDPYEYDRPAQTQVVRRQPAPGYGYGAPAPYYGGYYPGWYGPGYGYGYGYGYPSWGFGGGLVIVGGHGGFRRFR